MVGKAVYRVKQLGWALTARPLSPTQQATIEQILSPAEQQLFGRFSYNDQQHSLRVANLLRQADHHQPELLKSALLHDIGKTAVNLTVIDRCVVVLGSLLAPKRALKWGGDGQEWSAEQAKGWRKPFVVKQQHPAWSAQMAQAAGSPPLTITLIERHQDIIRAADKSAEATLIRIHQWADDQS